MTEFQEAKKQLLQETKEKRLALLQSLDFLWLSSELHKQYTKADQADDVRSATNVLSVLADKLKLFERAESSRLQTKSEKWSANDLKTVQMDLIKHAIEQGNVNLAVRVIESIGKSKDKTDDIIDYEAQLQDLLTMPRNASNKSKSNQ
jgi:hypothetical protein